MSDPQNTPGAEPDVKNPGDTLKKVFDMLKSKKAPAQIGQPVYAKDMELLKMGGVTHIKDFFGQKLDDKSNDPALPINLGSKLSSGFLPDDVRMRLFNLKKTLHNMEIQAAAQYRGQHVTPDMMKTTKMYIRHLEPQLKAFNITDFSEWIPTVNSRFFFEEFEIPFLLADQFDQQPMDSPTVNVPGDTGNLKGVEETDVATFNSQSNAQASYVAQSRNNVVHTDITNDLLSDSAPAYIERLRRSLMKGTVRSYEDTILNGDTSGSPRGNSHQDSDTQALALNATFGKAFDGIRRKAFANEVTNPGKVIFNHGGDTASKIMFANIMKLMGKMASEKDDLFWAIPSGIETDLVTGAIPELFTAFAFGGLASNVTGQVPPVFGVKPVTSQFAREDLNAAGVFDGVITTFTTVALIKRSRFLNFLRQATRIWAAPSLPSSDELLMTAKTRQTWNGNPQTLEELSITMAINVLAQSA